MPKNSPFTATQLAALDHYVRTGRTSLLDGAEGREGRYSEHSLSPDVDQWRMDVPAVAEKLSTSIHYDTLRSSPITSVKPRRSIHPKPSSNLGINSREEISQPRDISVWRLAIPPHCQPPDDLPWTSHVTESEDFEYEQKAENVREPLETAEPRSRPIELKAGPDIHATAVPLASTLQSSSGTSPEALNSWRYENFVDWWRSGIKADNEARRLSGHDGADGPEEQGSHDGFSKENYKLRMGAPSSRTSISESRIHVTSKRHSLSKRPASRSHSIHTDRRTKMLQSPPPPPPTGVIESPATTMEDYQAEASTQESLTKVYYRLITRNNDRLPVRDYSGCGDKSIGVLVLENPSSYRAADLRTLIMSRECSHVNNVSTAVAPVPAPLPVPPLPPPLSPRKSRNKLKKPSSPNLGKGFHANREPVSHHDVSFTSSPPVPLASSIHPTSPQWARSPPPAFSPDVSTLPLYPGNSPNPYLDPLLSIPSNLLSPPLLPVQEEEQLPIKLKVNLYYVNPTISHQSTRKTKTKVVAPHASSSPPVESFVRLRDSDPIPFGVGSDESSALIVEIFASLPGKPTTMVTRLVRFMKRCLFKMTGIFKPSSTSRPSTKEKYR